MAVDAAALVAVVIGARLRVHSIEQSFSLRPEETTTMKKRGEAKEEHENDEDDEIQKDNEAVQATGNHI